MANDAPEEVQRWTAKRRVALVVSILKGETSVWSAPQSPAHREELRVRVKWAAVPALGATEPAPESYGWKISVESIDREAPTT